MAASKDEKLRKLECEHQKNQANLEYEMNKLKIRQKMLEQDYEAKKNQIEEKSDNILEFEIPNEVLIKMIIYFF